MTDNQIAGTHLKILVVDDDVFFRQLLSRILTAAGYLVIEARSVSDAICALEQAPDLAIIDYRIPANDGASFINELREKYDKFPIVFCSSSSIDQKTFASMCNIYQVDLIVQKPIQAEMFVQQIEELLCARQNKQQEHSVAPIRKPILNEHNQTLDEFLPQDKLPCQSEEAARAIRETEQAIAELSWMYLLELPNDLDQMTVEIQEAAIQYNTSALRQATSRAHQIKGTAGSLGFDTLSKIGAILEKKLIALGQEELNGDDHVWGEIFASLTQARVWIKEKVEELKPGKSLETTARRGH
jgi:CheY-like chemotaxis protein